MIEKKELTALVDAFLAYRDLLTPMQENLGAFLATYDGMRTDVEKLNASLGGGMGSEFRAIVDTLSKQAKEAAALQTRMEEFSTLTARYAGEVQALFGKLEKMEQKIAFVNELEQKAEAQIARLDELIEEKTKTYNIKELKRTLDSYNQNVERVTTFINDDVAKSLQESGRALDSIKGGLENVLRERKGEEVGIQGLLETNKSMALFLQKIAEKGDVDELYLFDVLDKWAAERKVKIKKK